MKMKVLIDNQIFETQHFGGISRYFNELKRESDVIIQMKCFKDRPAMSFSIADRIKQIFSSYSSTTKKVTINKFDFYNSQLVNLDYQIFHPTYYDTYFVNHLKRPFVITVHDMIHEKFPEYFENNIDS